MKNCKKVVSVLLSLLLISLSAVTVFADNGSVTIINPYENVNWQTYNRYKADLHCHTNSSDGSNTLKEMVEKHYELGYDILAVSDHGTVSYSWTQQNIIASIKLFSMLRKGVSAVEVLNENGTAANGKSYTVVKENGDDYYTQTGGNSMLRVPFAIENNPTSFNNAHVNSFFADYGNGVLGGTSDYVTPISSIDALGGISVINHPGEYTSARDEVYASDAYNKSSLHYKYDIEKFENLLMKYSTCIGIDINSKGDSRTRFDRKLWDTMLTDLAPYGRNVFAVATSDAHNLGIVNSGYVIALMPENTSSALQNCLSNGEMFACSRYIGNLDELKAYASMLEGTTLGADIKNAVDAIDTEIAQSGKQSTIFSFDEDASAPYIESISVDNDANTITISGEGIECIRWISEGKAVAEGSVIDVDDCGAEGYVRAEIIGEGGITYTQAFLLDDGSVCEYSSSFKDLGFVAKFPDAIIKFLGTFEVIYRSILDFMNVI